jgi:hypothetical protein
MKLLTAFTALMLSGLALAQTPPPSGSRGSTINNPGTVNDPDPIPAPRTDRTRPQWNPNPGPTSPTPRPQPDYRRPQPTPQPRPDYRRPEPTPEPRTDYRRPEPRPDYRQPERNDRDPNMVYVGDYVLYQGNEYEVLGGSQGTLEVRTPFSNQRHYIPIQQVARTHGCVQSYYGPVCVGDMTVGLNNVYYAVIGIEWSGRVVVQTTDVTRTVYGQIDANSLKVVR